MPNMPIASRRRNILYYCSGFYYIGGVEVFEADLITSMPDELAERSVAVWSEPVKNLPLLTAIRDVADHFSRSPIRWGCRWDIPDRILLPMGLRLAAKADLMVFSKLLPTRIHLRLRQARGVGGGTIPSVLVCSYRPAEMWPKGAPPGLLECFDVIVVAAKSFAQDLVDVGYRGRTKILNLLPPEPPAVTAPPPVSMGDGLIRLGFLGRLEAPKNIPYLMRITELLVTQYHLRVELHLFGEGAQRRHLESLVAASEALRSRVVLHGMIQAREKWSAIDSCDIFLNTSFTEGQCIVALEVLSRGRPLAATPVGALPDILDDPQTGDLIPLNDAGAAAKIVADLAARWTGGGITPAAIRDHFEKRFGRKATVAAYAELFREMMET